VTCYFITNDMIQLIISAQTLIFDIITIAMAPKKIDGLQPIKSSDMKAAAKLLLASKAAKSLQEKKRELKTEIQKLAAERKKAQRRARNLKKKASKIDASELMQMVMMKAFVLNKASTEATSSGSSSSDEWIPQNAQAAMDKIFDLSVAGGDTDLAAFVKNVSAIVEPS